VWYFRGHSHIREARRGDAVRRTRVQESVTESKLVKRGEVRWYRAASLAMLCNTFIVEAYTNRRGEAR